MDVQEPLNQQANRHHGCIVDFNHNNVRVAYVPKLIIPWMAKGIPVTGFFPFKVYGHTIQLKHFEPSFTTLY